MKPKFIYVMDPMCSWCWAFHPVIEKLQSSFSELEWDYVMGGLAPDSEEPMHEQMRMGIESIWHQIEERTGTRFNYDFWRLNTPRRSTYSACRAVIAFHELVENGDQLMVNAIQQAYYLEAKNPSDIEVLTSLADQLGLKTSALNSVDFKQLLKSPETEAKLQQHLLKTQQLGVQGFPSLFLEQGQTITPLSHGYTAVDNILDRLTKLGISETN